MRVDCRRAWRATAGTADGLTDAPLYWADDCSAAREGATKSRAPSRQRCPTLASLGPQIARPSRSDDTPWHFSLLGTRKAKALELGGHSRVVAGSGAPEPVPILESRAGSSVGRAGDF